MCGFFFLEGKEVIGLCSMQFNALGKRSQTGEQWASWHKSAAQWSNNFHKGEKFAIILFEKKILSKIKVIGLCLMQFNALGKKKPNGWTMSIMTLQCRTWVKQFKWGWNWSFFKQIPMAADGGKILPRSHQPLLDAVQYTWKKKSNNWHYKIWGINLFLESPIVRWNL